MICGDSMSKETLTARLQYYGGRSQLERDKQLKLFSFKSALKNSYASRTIKCPNKMVVNALLTTDNQKSDYNKQRVSVDFSSGLEEGDVFETLDDGKHYMVYLRNLNEIAYLNAEVIECRYQLEINNQKYWVYFQGPTETDIRWFLKNGINANELNLSGTVYIRKDKNTLNFFHRFTKIEIEGMPWQVQVVDSVTVPGIIELEVQEYYSNFAEKLPKVNRVENDVIIGNTEVDQQDEVGYQIREAYYNKDYSWSIVDNPRVKILDVYQDGYTCKIKVYKGAVGSFTVRYGDKDNEYLLPVTILPVHKTIDGPQEVYPYDTVTYTTEMDGNFYIDTKLAKIVSKTSNSCEIEIKTGKSGEFNLYFADNDDNEYVLPITIGSLM